MERVSVPLFAVPAVATALTKVFAGIPVPEIAEPTLKFVVVMLVRLAEFIVVFQLQLIL